MQNNNPKVSNILTLACKVTGKRITLPEKDLMQAGTILIVDDNKSVLTSLELLLEDEFEGVETASNPNSILSVLDSRPVDLVLLDMNFSAGVNTGNEGLFWLRRIREIAPELPVIMLTAYGDVELVVRALKGGAADFVLKPWDNDNLIGKIRAALRERKSSQLVHPVERPSEPAMIIGHSPVMMKLIKVVTKVAKTDANVLITGENGTGKEMLAREIHRLSLRSGREMVNVDMGAVSESLFESELFGHCKGAFTDAHTDRIGKFEIAQGGTLFLDEIGNLSYHLQAKLLSAIQSRTIVRVGSNRSVETDVRLICATNQNLQAMVAQERFRRDLLYRINTIHIEIPPLRQRREDIVPLARLFLEKYAAKYGKQGIRIDEEACRKLQEYDWYGNIRELQHTVEKAVIICDSMTIGQESLLMTPQQEEPNAGGVSTLEEMERNMIRQAIRLHESNMSAVAAQLGITRQTLYNKIKKYGL